MKREAKRLILGRETLRLLADLSGRGHKTVRLVAAQSRPAACIGGSQRPRSRENAAVAREGQEFNACRLQL